MTGFLVYQLQRLLWSIQLPKLCVHWISSFCVCVLYQMWCQVPPLSPHQPTTFLLCPRSKPWPRTQTAAALTHWRDRWTRVSEHSPLWHVSTCLIGSVLLNNIQRSTITFPSFLLSPSYLIFRFFFCPFSILCVYPFLLTSMNRSIFLFSFYVSPGWSSSTSWFLLDCCLDVKASYSPRFTLSSLWILFNLIRYIWCMHLYGFSGYQESLGNCYICMPVF